jgi:hypothetical protein
VSFDYNAEADASRMQLLMEPRPFLKNRYRVKLSNHSDADNWSGGKPSQLDARCPSCKIPLLLLWDINCRDSRFPRRKFGPLERLPLYYCWGCVNDISYQVADHDKIKIYAKKRRNGPSFPYKPYPKYFKRRGLQFFEGVPDSILRIYHELLARWEIDEDDENAAVPVPTAKQQKELTQFFGHRVVLPRCFFHHQLGGKPLHQLWADEVFQCPNPACEGTSADRVRGRKRAMKFLAGVLNDPWAGLPMVEEANAQTKKDWNYDVSVQYHICDCCWTVLGCNRCD